MGCSSSQQTEPSGSSSGGCRVFKVTLLNGRGEESCSGQLEVTFQDLILHQKGKDQIQWPLWSLRRYGCDKDLFLFESGRRCPTGPGSFAFRCQQAEALFNLLHLSVVWTGQSQNNRLSTIDELDPSVPSAVLNEMCQEFQSHGNSVTANGTTPNYINDPAHFKYYNVLGHWRDDVCHAINYADLDLSVNEGGGFTENEVLASSHSYVNVGNKEHWPPYINFPVNTGNCRPYVNVPAKTQEQFSVQLSKPGRPQRPRSLDWYGQSCRGCRFEDAGYLNPRRDLSVGNGVGFPTSSLDRMMMNGAGNRRGISFRPSCDAPRRGDALLLPLDNKPAYASIDVDETLAVGSRQGALFNHGLKKTRHSCEIETMYYC